MRVRQSLFAFIQLPLAKSHLILSFFPLFCLAQQFREEFFLDVSVLGFLYGFEEEEVAGGGVLRLGLSGALLAFLNFLLFSYYHSTIYIT